MSGDSGARNDARCQRFRVRAAAQVLVLSLHRWPLTATMQIERRTEGTVLVIDDDDAMRRVLRDFLQRDGHRVVEAANGEAAVSMVEVESIDVVILDKEMPGMNGMDVLSFLHRRFPSTPVILITAFGGPHVAEESFRRGAVEYIEKPFRLSNVVDRVQKLIDDAP